MSEEEIMNSEVAVEEPKPKKRGRKSKKEDENKITGAVDSTGFVTATSDIEKDSMVKASDVASILVESMEQAYLEWSYPGLFKDRDNEDPVKDLVKADVVFEGDFQSFKIFDLKTVCEEDDIVDDSYQISLEDAKEFDPECKLGDTVHIPFDVKQLGKAYVRRVKQLFQSHLKDASHQAILSVYSNRIGGLISGIITKADVANSSYEVSFGKTSGFLKRNSLIPSDRFNVGDEVLVYLADVSEKMNTPSLVISRSHEKFVLELMKRAIPEIQTGDVKIKAVAREPGKRTKVFVESTNPNLDPIGACVGPESARIRTVINELHGEKIDVLKYYSNKAMQIIEAMKPATIIGLSCPDDFFDLDVHYDELETEPEYEFPKITAVVMNGNQGVAIGTSGVNVRLASRISMCTISVLEADEAIKQGLKYYQTSEIEKIVAQMNQDMNPETVEKAPASEENADIEEEEDIDVETPAENKPAAPVEETKPVEPVVSEPETKKEEIPSATSEIKAEEEKVEHVEIKNKPKISLEELEQALETKKGPAETRSYKKRFYHNNDDKKEEKKDDKAVNVKNAMPIYTEEELKQIEESQNSNTPNDNGDYDDIDYDQYDSDQYYDDNNKN